MISPILKVQKACPSLRSGRLDSGQFTWQMPAHFWTDKSPIVVCSTITPGLAEPAMEELVDKVHESCSASVLDGTEIVYVLRVPTRKIMTINHSIGSRLPAFCTSMGRVLLGNLDDAGLDAVMSQPELKPHTKCTVTNPTRLKNIIAEDRKKGWSLIDQELEEGLCSIAVPLIDFSGRTIAAMNIGDNVTRTSGADLVKKVLPELPAAAIKINTALKLRRS